MKILLVSVKNEKSRGGIAVWTKSYLEQCSAHGIECDLVNVQMRGTRATDGTAKRNVLDEIFRTIDILRQLKRFLRNGDQYEAAHLNTSCGTYGLLRDYLVASMIVRKGIPLITHYHCDISRAVKSDSAKKTLEKLAAISKKNLVLCDKSLKYLQNQFGLSALKVPNFIGESLVIKQDKVIAQEIKRIAFVGRVSEAKGAAEIYELAQRFSEKSFVLMGDVSEAVSEWDKPKNIELMGGMPHEQVIEQLDQSDIFLFPSHSEGFSIALMEGMARGVPSIATDVGAAADMLADGCGVVVDKGDVEAMAQAIHELENLNIRSEVSKKATKKVTEFYTTNAVMKLLRSIYECV